MRHYLFCLTIALAFASQASAAIVFDAFIRIEGQDLDSPLFVVDPGLTFSDVEVVFRETVTDGDASNFVGRTLNSAGVDILSSVPGAVTGAARSPILFFATGDNDADTFGGTTFGAGIPGVDLGGGVTEAVIGTFDLMGPAAAGDQVVVTLADPRIGPDDFTFSGLAGFGDSNINFRSVTLSSITAVPEPGSVAFLLGASCFGLVRRRKRN